MQTIEYYIFDMKEKDRLWIEYIETDKGSKKRSNFPKASIKMKSFQYHQGK